MRSINVQTTKPTRIRTSTIHIRPKKRSKQSESKNRTQQNRPEFPRTKGINFLHPFSKNRFQTHVCRKRSTLDLIVLTNPLLFLRLLHFVLFSYKTTLSRLSVIATNLHSSDRHFQPSWYFHASTNTSPCFLLNHEIVGQNNMSLVGKSMLKVKAKRIVTFDCELLTSVSVAENALGNRLWCFVAKTHVLRWFYALFVVESIHPCRVVTFRWPSCNIVGVSVPPAFVRNKENSH